MNVLTLLTTCQRPIQDNSPTTAAATGSGWYFPSLALTIMNQIPGWGEPNSCSTRTQSNIYNHTA